jgi:hypothetical protein
MKNFGSNVLGRRSVSAGMDTTVTCLVMSFLRDLGKNCRTIQDVLSSLSCSCDRFVLGRSS